MKIGSTNYYTQSQLLDRGWSQAMVNRFLPCPCKYKENYKNPKYAKMKLYSARRVHAVEDSMEFIEAFRKKQERSQAIIMGMYNSRG